MTEAIGQKTVEARARLHNLSKNGDDSGRLQTTPGDNELYTRQRVINQLRAKVARHQSVTKTALIGFESRWGRQLPYNSFALNALGGGAGPSCSAEAGATPRLWLAPLDHVDVALSDVAAVDDFLAVG